MVDYSISGLKALTMYTIRVSVENRVSDQVEREPNTKSCEISGSTGDISECMHACIHRYLRNVPYRFSCSAEFKGLSECVLSHSPF